MKLQKILFTLAMGSILFSANNIFAADATATTTPKKEENLEFGDEFGEFDNLDNTKKDSKPAASTGSSTTNTKINTNTKETKIDIGWGYQSTQKITLKTADTTYLLLESPVIKDGNGTTINRYRAVFATKSIAETAPEKLKDKTFDFSNITGNTIQMKLEGLTENTKYYVVIIPINVDNIDGNESMEANFTTTAKPAEVKKEEPKATATNTSTTTKPATNTGHGAADIKMQNISYTYTGNTITLTWTPAAGATKVDIFLKASDQNDYTKISTTDMNKGSYNFEATKNGLYFVKLIPTDDNSKPVGAETIQSVKFEKGTPTQPKKEKMKETKNGPALNLLITIMMLGLGGYSFVRFKNYNK